MIRILMLVLSALVVVVNCSETKVIFLPCEAVSDEKCTITNVNVDPCSNKPSSTCTLKRGKNAAMSFDYVPKFSAEKLSTSISYNGVNFEELDSNACEFTKCPAVAEQSATLSYNLNLNKKLPKGNYPVEWKLWDETNEQNICCFKMNLKLR